jgi:hypothetical protein
MRKIFPRKKARDFTLIFQAPIFSKRIAGFKRQNHQNRLEKAAIFTVQIGKCLAEKHLPLHGIKVFMVIISFWRMRAARVLAA